jgi:hypothetical protein
VTALAAGGTVPPSWHDDAFRLGAALDHVAAALVVGRDGGAAAWAALGAARAQASRRRVAIADLVGDAPALIDLGEGDEPVGISDSFFYGVTLNKIARPVDAEGTLYVLPSGSEPVAVEEVLSSDRWRRLVGGFREAGALLLLAAQADAPGLGVLAANVDGLVVVGDLGGLLPDAPAPLIVIPSPTPRARPGGGPRAGGARPGRGRRDRGRRRGRDATPAGVAAGVPAEDRASERSAAAAELAAPDLGARRGPPPDAADAPNVTAASGEPAVGVAADTTAGAPSGSFAEQLALASSPAGARATPAGPARPAVPRATPPDTDVGDPPPGRSRRLAVIAGAGVAVAAAVVLLVARGPGRPPTPAPAPTPRRARRHRPPPPRRRPARTARRRRRRSRRPATSGRRSRCATPPTRPARRRTRCCS